jgi:hypothetical protein
MIIDFIEIDDYDEEVSDDDDDDDDFIEGTANNDFIV